MRSERVSSRPIPIQFLRKTGEASMIVSWNWLREYVAVDIPVEDVVDRLTMTGLNLEETQPIADDLAIDLEVTSNRPDCLGHIGVAREVSVLFDVPMTTPDAELQATGGSVSDATSVDLQCPELCTRYSARVIRNVKVGPSPDWMQKRLEAVGLTPVNNIVDITNYVLMETAQPLHAFDFDKLKEGRIVVRRATPGEKLIAINQKEYPLDPDMCIIADAQRPVAIAGVMGGLETEIGDDTTTVLIESAGFRPRTIRNTARKLNLQSDSSYRFERPLDPRGVDWASRRCCELILELAGGELLSGSVEVESEPLPNRDPIELRFGQIPRLLGIDIPREESLRILTELGFELETEGRTSARLLPPTWRSDLTREVDLIEEVARIHGYENIPEDAFVPMGPSYRTQRDRVLDRVRRTLTAVGAFECVTLSFVSDELCELFRPRGNEAALHVEHSSRRHENVLRQSLIPSLLVSRRENERQGNANAELFEVARVFLSADRSLREQETEPIMVSMVSGRSFRELRGVVETLASAVNPKLRLQVEPSDLPAFSPGRGAELLLAGNRWGWLGELRRDVTDRLDLRDAVTGFEV